MVNTNGNSIHCWGLSGLCNRNPCVESASVCCACWVDYGVGEVIGSLLVSGCLFSTTKLSFQSVKSCVSWPLVCCSPNKDGSLGLPPCVTTSLERLESCLLCADDSWTWTSAVLATIQFSHHRFSIVSKWSSREFGSWVTERSWCSVNEAFFFWSFIDSSAVGHNLNSLHLSLCVVNLICL